MNIYRFSVTLPDYQDFLRVIDIPGNYSFEDLHLAILSAVDFDDSQLASFYLSDQAWNVGQEITLMDMGEDTSPLTMKDARIDAMLDQKGAHLIYVYDFILMWGFYLEVQDITEPNPEWEYPILVEEVGAPPDQYGDKGHYPDKISDEDQQLIDKLKSQGLNLGFGGGHHTSDSDSEDYGTDEEDPYY